MGICLRRREFIAGLGGAAVWPTALRAQQHERPRRIGMLLGGATESDPTYQAWIAEFRDSLAKLGWIEGRNLEIDLRRVPNGIDRIRAQAAEKLKEVQPHLARVAYVQGNNNSEAEAGASRSLYRGPTQAATQALGDFATPLNSRV
jgi:hypothetical protein